MGPPASTPAGSDNRVTPGVSCLTGHVGMRVMTTAMDLLRGMGLKSANPPKPVTCPGQAWHPASASGKAHRRRCPNRTYVGFQEDGVEKAGKQAVLSQLLGDWPVVWVKRMLSFRGTRRVDLRLGSRGVPPWVSDKGGLESRNRAALECPARGARWGREAWPPRGSPGTQEGSVESV